MRALHVIPSVADRDGGPSKAVVSMCGALGQRQVDTLILSTNADGRTTLDVPLGVTTRWRGIPALFFRRNTTDSFKYSRGLSRWVAQHAADFDVVHIHAVLSHAPIAAAAACRRDAIPYVVRPLGTVASWSLEQKAWRKRLLMAVAGDRMLRNAAAIHYTTEEERVDVEGTRHLANGVVIPLGVDVPRLASNDRAARDADPFVLFLSRLHPKKQLEQLIDGFAAARTRVARPWRLLVAGDGDESYVRSLEQRARARCGDAVTFLGWMSGAEKDALIARASLYALPSRHENFGVSVLEAMAAGVPVVLSPHVQLASPVAAAGAGWVTETDPTSLAGVLVEAMSNGAERERRGMAAQELARCYSWPTIADELIALYQRVCDRAAATPSLALQRSTS